MNEPFLFVNPKSLGGPRDAYSKRAPRYPYCHSSWEWILERALRRKLILGSLSEKTHARDILSLHEDQYHLYRWTTFGAPGYSKDSYQAEHPNDAYAIPYRDRYADLPQGWSSSGPALAPTEVVYETSYMVGSLVFRLIFDHGWLAPEWDRSCLDKWNLSATTTETTSGTRDPQTGDWTWSTTAEHLPFSIPDDFPFKCLSYMRTDDPTVTVTIDKEDGSPLAVETAKTPASVAAGDSVTEYDGTQVRSAQDGAALHLGDTNLYDMFYIWYRKGRSYPGDTPATGASPYAGDYTGDTITDLYVANGYTLGCLTEVPDKDSGYVLSSTRNSSSVSYDKAWARFVPNVSWGEDDHPTWWHEHEFPKGLDSVLSPKLRDQLKKLCPVCQPVIPPMIPALWYEFPAGARTTFTHAGVAGIINGYGHMNDGSWNQHLSLAAVPFDLSARLDALTTTVHKVPYIAMASYEMKKSVTETTQESRDGEAWIDDKVSETTTIKGFGTNLLNGIGGSVSESTEHTSILHSKSPDGNHVDTTNVTSSVEHSASYAYLLCLRSTSGEGTDLTKARRTVTRTEKRHYIPSGDPPTETTTETTTGEEPATYDVDPEDLMFPDWLLPWIDSAELFMHLESRILYDNAYSTTEVTKTTTPESGPPTYQYSGSGSGHRTHAAMRSFVSLGTMDIATGRFPEVDIAGLLAEHDPDPNAATAAYGGDYISSTETASGESATTETSTIADSAGPLGTRERTCQLYVVVKWKFDREDPEPFDADSPLPGLYRNLRDAQRALADAQRDLERAESELPQAEHELEVAQEALDDALDRQSDPDTAENRMVAEATTARDKAQTEYDTAEDWFDQKETELIAATAECNNARLNYEDAYELYQALKDNPNPDQEAISDAKYNMNRKREILEEKTEELASATKARAKALEGKEKADAELEKAQEYLDTVSDELLGRLQDAVDKAREAAEKAQARVTRLTSAKSGAESLIPELEAAVEAAERALQEALDERQS